MLKRFYIVISALVFSAFVAVSGAQAVSVDPSFIANYNNDDGVGSITDFYTFDATADTNLKFIFSVNHPSAGLGVGITDLVMTWSDGSVEHIITNALGVVVGVPFFHSLLNGESATLSVVGDFLTNGGGYTLTVAAVPLPPALIAFSTAMLGVGFLARRRRKKKATFA